MLAKGDDDVDERDAVDELGGQHPSGAVLAVDARDALEWVPLSVLVEQHGLASLDRVVELVGRPACELLDDLATAGGTKQAGPVEHPGGRVHQFDVRLEGLPNARSLHLDGHRFAASQPCPVHLADRGCRERLDGELAEDHLGHIAELLAHDLAHLFVGERLDLVEELEQLVAVGRRQQVEAHCQHLPELDPSAPEGLEGHAQAHRATRVGVASEGQPGKEVETDEDKEDVPHPLGVSEQCPHTAPVFSSGLWRDADVRASCRRQAGCGAWRRAW